jgi:hypothetical protein
MFLFTAFFPLFFVPFYFQTGYDSSFFLLIPLAAQVLTTGQASSTGPFHSLSKLDNLNVYYDYQFLRGQFLLET